MYLDRETTDNLKLWVKNAESNIRAVKKALKDLTTTRIKLDQPTADRIRILHAQGVSKEELADRFNVKVSTIKNVLTRVSWKDE